MDPDANLQEMMELSAKLYCGISNGYRSLVEYEDDVDRLAELVEALDQWMSTGGYLPARWQRTNGLPRKERPNAQT